MKKRIVERPDSTTHFLEYPFHLIKDEKEADNIFRNVNQEQILVCERYVDSVTFQPWIAFVIFGKDKNFSQSLKFCGDIGKLAKYSDFLVDF